MDSSIKLLPQELWNEEQSSRYQLNGTTKHVLLCALPEEYILKVINITYGKKMWKTLEMSCK